jgi:hypothetical protein
MKPTYIIALAVLLSALSIPATAQDYKTNIPQSLTAPSMSQAQQSKLSEIEDRLIYSRAFETILWENPMLAVYCLDQANRDLGAGNTDVIYTGEKPDYQWGGVTYNVQSPYWVSTFNVKDGPIVIDLPRPGRKPASSLQL